jgi:hypothetical protein
MLFPTLPLRFREQIYRHVLLPHTSHTHLHQVIITASDSVHNNDPRYPAYLPRFCRVNSVTRIEVRLWFIRNTEFGLLYPQYLFRLAQRLSILLNNTGSSALLRFEFHALGDMRQAL